MSQAFDRIVEIMAALRAPGGCPWDRKQTHESLKPYLLEETYEVLETIDQQDKRKLREELGDVLPLFPKNATYYFCKPNIPRGLEASLLQEKALQFSLNGNTYDSVAKAYMSAQNNATKSDFIYVGGSTFVVAELPLNKEV